MNHREQNERAADYWKERPASSGLLGPGRALGWLLRPLARLNPKTVVEVGCGSGRNLGDLWHGTTGVHFYGVDINPALIDYAQAKYHRYGIEFSCADVNKVGSIPECDVCLSVSFLDHIPKPKATLDMMLRHAKHVVLIEPYDGTTRPAHEATDDFSFLHDYPALCRELGASCESDAAPMGNRGMGPMYKLFICSREGQR